ncbi:hypothetical protein [Streptosporangium subroseum]|uniref:hypothetical protein n=1 Tax=Streptosporangium subroseum TaxID=106412 RepID=UPI003092BAA2|nr:hypothetical protein OHB15_24325 [Streptosporangium subroseum]
MRPHDRYRDALRPGPQRRGHRPAAGLDRAKRLERGNWGAEVIARAITATIVANVGLAAAVLPALKLLLE